MGGEGRIIKGRTRSHLVWGFEEKGTQGGVHLPPPPIPTKEEEAEEEEEEEEEGFKRMGVHLAAV